MNTLRPISRQILRKPQHAATRCMSTAPPQQAKNLTWVEYLETRKSKKRWQTATTIPMSLVGLFGGIAYFSSLETDPTKPILGIDPFIFYGAATVACAGLGWVVGPSLGTAAWRMTTKHNIKAMDIKDREFYQHIARNRVDATLQSPTNPIPDYYGEKIGSIPEYRRWLRDQAKYRRKAILAER